MSFSGGPGISVGTLSANFVLNSSAATASISSIINQTNTLKQSFSTTNIIKVDTAAATAGIEKTTAAANGLKRALEFGGAILAFGLVTKAIDGIGDAIFGTNAKIQQATTSITALTGSAQTANDMVGKLETLASHSTFGLAQLTQSAQQLLAFGVAAQNVPPLLQAIQNAAAASGGDITEKLGRINYVIAELNSGIPLSARQLRQLATAGVPLDALAKQLGITVDQLMTAGKTGLVTSEQLVTAFQYVYTHGNLGDFMSKQAGTFTGAMNLIKTNVGLAISQAFKPLFDSVSSLIVKFGLFVQTQTFQNWVTQIGQGVKAVMGFFQQLAAVIEPVTSAIAGFFGLTGSGSTLAAEMDAAKNMTVDVGQYDASLQSAGKAVDDTKAKTAEYKKTIDDAALALVGINGDLAANKLLLDANARAITAVKNAYDPTIAAAQESIRKLSLLTPDELSRKAQELQLDKDRANLELTRPDTSMFDARILGDQTTLANMPALDTSRWDTAISGYQEQIQALQESISNLNTNEFDEKINAIRDKLAEPAPDTTGITNQLAGLNAALAGGTISQSAFNAQYGALSLQKQGIETQHAQATTGLQGQLKLLEAQRTDQALANRETAQADRQRIRDLQDQVKIQEKGRTDAQKADAAARRALEADIRREEALRTAALKPYTDALKVITDQQQRNSLLDAAANAQRTLDLAPYKKALDDATEAKRLGLIPLDEEKQRLDDIQIGLNEQKAMQSLIRQEAEAQAAALRDGAAAAKLLTDNLAKIPTSAPGATAVPKDAFIGPIENSPFAAFVQQASASLAELTGSDDWSVIFKGKHKDGTPVGVKGRFDTAVDDVFKGIDKIDRGLQSWIKDHDADGMWGVLIYGKNPDGSTATVKQQLGVFFGGINDFITNWLATNGPKWLTSWSAIGTELGKAWDASASFNWVTVGHTLGGINEGIDTWLSTHAPGWLTNWDTLGTGLRNLWDGPESFNWTSVGTFFTGIATGIDAFATEHFPGWLTSWQGLATGLGAAFSGLGGIIGGHLSGAKTEIGNFFSFIGGGVHWLAKHFPGVSDIPDYGNDNGAVAPGSGSVGSFGTPPVTSGVPGYAGGLLNSTFPGHWAVVGEKGPEIQYIPRGSSIIPHDLSKAVGMLPGHADGLNFDFLGDVLGTVGRFVSGSAEKAVNALMDKIGTPDVGVFPGLGTSLFDIAKTGLLNFLRPQEVAQSLGSGVYGGASGPQGSSGATAGSGNWHNPVPGYQAVQGSWTHGGTHDHEAAVDWATPYGTSILAPDSGTAGTVWNGDGATGRTGIMDHGNGWVTYYGHVSDFGIGGFLRDAMVGHTGSPERDGGAGSGAHLHFAMRENGAYMRPEDYIPGIFGLATGGLSVGGDPRVVMVGDGPSGEREFHMPEPELRAIVRQEAGGITIMPGAITVVAPPGANGQQFGKDFGDGFLVSMRQSGRIATR